MSRASVTGFFALLLAVLVHLQSVDGCTVNEVCTFNKPSKHKMNASVGEFTTYITKKSSCSLIVFRADKKPIKKISCSTTGHAQFLYTPNILKNELYLIKQAIIYNTSCPTGQLAYFDLLQLNLEPNSCNDYISIYFHQSPPHHIVGQNITVSGTPLVGNISYLLFRSNHKDVAKGFKGYLQCFDPGAASSEGCTGDGGRKKRQSGNSHIPSGSDLVDLHMLREAAFNVTVLAKRNFSDQEVSLALKHESSCNGVLKALSNSVLCYTEEQQPGRVNGLRPTTTTASTGLKVITPPPSPSGHCVSTATHFPRCSSIGYRSTYLPNFDLETSNVTDILNTMSLYDNLIYTHKCSNAFLHLVCLVYAPICINNTRYKICRNLCDYVRNDCASAYEGHTLPTLLQCDNMDIYSTGTPSVCPPLDSFNTTTPAPVEEVTTSKKVIRPISDKHTCSNMTEDLSFCSSMNWTSVSFPNWRGHKTQKEAGSEIIEFQYSQLVATQCSPYIQHLICSYYAPVCTGVNRVNLAPCRCWCEMIGQTCIPILISRGFPVPDFLQCSNFSKGQPCFSIPINGTNCSDV